MQNSSFPYYSDFSSNDLSINNAGSGNSNNGSIDMSKSHIEVPPGKKKKIDFFLSFESGQGFMQKSYIRQKFSLENIKLYE